MRALVIDDSVAIRGILRMALKQVGFEVAEAANGRHALEVLETTGPADVALIDWNMPEMGGLEVVKRLRIDERFDHMKIMMVTTETDLAQVQHALQSGADEYLMKPFTCDCVLGKLQLLGFKVPHHE